MPIGATTNGLAVTAGNFPVNYPHTWLRLNRVGNVFTGFGSYDGTNWTQLGTVTIAMPAQIYLGLAVASHNTNQSTTAQFVDYETTPASAVVATITNPHDAIGPSSRMTPLAFSEIMWKPAPRTDGKNLEFLDPLQFQSVVSGHQQLSNHLRGHELHLPAQHADSRWRLSGGGGGAGGHRPVFMASPM